MELEPKSFEELEYDLLRVSILLDCGILGQRGLMPDFIYLRESVFIEVVLRLRDALSKFGELVKSFPPTTESKFVWDHLDERDSVKEIENLENAIVWVRDAICHINSEQNMVDPAQSRIVNRFNVIHGPGSMQINGRTATSEYTDDVAYFYGPVRLYLNCHVIALFNVMNERLSEMKRNGLWV